MGYKAIYRRFRPKTFDDLMGQEHITTILKNQIKNDSVAHAYLFSGIRGTGKTSTAKIFSRAVNCLNPQDGNPCNECEVCRGILDESLMDIIELDAASNNKVEDIRELKENSNYPPSKARYKVYIVDEVHMLSKGAFNAFLKTLEEPPEYVIFILATTEEQKLPATILSRCQRYEFKRIDSEEIVMNMKKICCEIGVDAEDRALALIARNSDGAMRDALSILDQCLALTDESLTYEQVLETIGSVDNGFLAEIVESLLEKDASRLILKFQELLKSGKDIGVFLKELINYFRNLMIIKSGVNYGSFLELPDEAIFELENHSAKISMNDILECIEALNRSEYDIKYTTQPKVVVEVSLLKLLESNRKKDLLQRIEDLEKAVSGDGMKTSSVEKKPIQVLESDVSVKKESTIKKNQASQDIDARALVEKTKTSEEKLEMTSKGTIFNDILDRWGNALDYVKESKIALHALLVEGKPLKFKDSLLTIGFGELFGFHRDAIDKEHNKENIEKLLSEYFKESIQVKFVMEYEFKDKDKETQDDLVEDVISVFGENKVIVE